jgi:hypothetical protein
MPQVYPPLPESGGPQKRAGTANDRIGCMFQYFNHTRYKAAPRAAVTATGLLNIAPAKIEKALLQK